MTKTLTIISIIGGIASTVSLLNGILLAGTTNSYEVIGFALVILLAAYVLFVPNTKLEQNVSGKIRTYDINKKPQLIDQTGEFIISGPDPVSVEFPIPFVETPKFEIINFKKYCRNLPEINKITCY
jgi:hypothetical protein